MAELIEQAYAPLVQGVSQQRPKDRQDGQVSIQENMSSDLAFGLRKRAASQYQHSIDVLHERASTTTYQTAVSGTRSIILVDTGLGILEVFDDSAELVYSSGYNAYLRATSSKAIQFTTVDSTVFVVNTEKEASEVSAKADSWDPNLGGYAFVVASAFSKTFNISITNKGKTYSGSYTTPTGSGGDDAANSTLTHIVDELVTSLETAGATSANGIHLYKNAGTISVKADSGTVSVTTNSGDAYMKASGTHQESTTTDLPSIVNSALDGFTMTIGTSGDPRYYTWDNTDQAWNEDSSYSSRVKPAGMPWALTYEDGWKLEEYKWEQRTSGDADSNETFNFLATGLITGISAFQGRLVILSGEYVCMSASNKPYRFYRSTVESLKADDPVEIASTTSIASPYRSAVVFNKDLLCFSDGYQAIIAGSQAVTPSNAAIAIVSTYECFSDVLPASTGQSLLFAAPRTSGYSGIWEATPSPYIDSSILGNDVTNHIPTYMEGRIDWIRSSSTVGLAVIALRDEPNALYVNEYLWSGSDKVQSAWHKWTLPSAVTEAQIIESTLWVLVEVGKSSLWVSMATRLGTGSVQEGAVPHLDYYVTKVTTADDRLTITGTEKSALGDYLLGYKMHGKVTDNFSLQGSYRYTPIPMTEVSVAANGDTTYQALGVGEGDTVIIGRPYLSVVQLTPPVLRDSSSAAVISARKQVYRYMVQVYNTGEFRWSASDKYHDTGEIQSSAYGMYSYNFNAGKPRVDDAVCILPARVDMNETALTLASDSVYDLNVSGVEYSFRYMQRFGRRR